MRLEPWLAVLLCVGIAGAQSDRKGSKFVGIYKLEPELVHPLVREQLPFHGRELDIRNLGFHASVPWKLTITPGKRRNEFIVESTPRLGMKKLIVPGLLNGNLQYGKRKRRLTRIEIYRDGAGTLRALNHSGSVGKVKRYQIMFVDLDHDGALGGVMDGFVVKPPTQRQWLNSRRELELHKMLDGYVFGDGAIHYFEVDPGGFELFVTVSKPDLTKPRLESNSTGLEHLNELRKKLGHDPVQLDPDLTRACELHCRYCALNGITHDQDKRMPGYTKEGAVAGTRSELTEASSMTRAVDLWLGTFFHRIRMLSPSIDRVGMGLVERAAALDTMSGLKARKFEAYAWPPDGATDIPVRWDHGEAPSPFGGALLASENAQQWGYPITLTFWSGDVTAAKVSLLDGDNIELPAFVSSPQEPSHKLFPKNMNTIFVSARKPLEPETKYTVVVECKFRDEPYRKSWTFTTK